MIRLNLTEEEYDSLVLMMGVHTGHLMTQDIELAKKVISLYVSIVGKKEIIVDPKESKRRKVLSQNEKAGFKFKEPKNDQTQH